MMSAFSQIERALVKAGSKLLLNAIQQSVIQKQAAG
ncbi:hypothetical protein Xmir_03201 [Xenorhabdus miraniensis]|uniref:Uncharacterized protein n=1 Tax=Xenorhabdus miraniensis TaxID=351674 RepID=A0A2D0JMD0_9GAMM|nr:hypothetical protein Xmir_03201 [Xenorhabdus miraniensis]